MMHPPTPKVPRFIYLLHPYRGSGRDTERPANLLRASQICRDIVLLGHIPLSPLHALSFLNDHDAEDRSLAMELCKSLIDRADEVWAFVLQSRTFCAQTGEMIEHWVESAGCRQDHQYALDQGKPISYHFHGPVEQEP